MEYTSSSSTAYNSGHALLIQNDICVLLKILLYFFINSVSSTIYFTPALLRPLGAEKIVKMAQRNRKFG